MVVRLYFPLNPELQTVRWTVDSFNQLTRVKLKANSAFAWLFGGIRCGGDDCGGISGDGTHYVFSPIRFVRNTRGLAESAREGCGGLQTTHARKLLCRQSRHQHLRQRFGRIQRSQRARSFGRQAACDPAPSETTLIRVRMSGRESCGLHGQRFQRRASCEFFDFGLIKRRLSETRSKIPFTLTFLIRDGVPRIPRACTDTFPCIRRIERFRDKIRNLAPHLWLDTDANRGFAATT